MCDGSEARKTREEKELVYVKVVWDGKPVVLFLTCQRMRVFGGTDANCLQAAFLEAFKAFNVDIVGKDASKLISVCADGASVIMGKRNGRQAHSSPYKTIIHLCWLRTVTCTNLNLQ